MEVEQGLEATNAEEDRAPSPSQPQTSDWAWEDRPIQPQSLQQQHREISQSGAAGTSSGCSVDGVAKQDFSILTSQVDDVLQRMLLVEEATRVQRHEPSSNEDHLFERLVRIEQTCQKQAEMSLQQARRLESHAAKLAEQERICASQEQTLANQQERFQVQETTLISQSQLLAEQDQRLLEQDQYLEQLEEQLSEFRDSMERQTHQDNQLDQHKILLNDVLLTSQRAQEQIYELGQRLETLEEQYEDDSLVEQEAQAVAPPVWSAVAAASMQKQLSFPSSNSASRALASASSTAPATGNPVSAQLTSTLPTGSAASAGISSVPMPGRLPPDFRKTGSLAGLVPEVQHPIQRTVPSIIRPANNLVGQTSTYQVSQIVGQTRPAPAATPPPGGPVPVPLPVSMPSVPQTIATSGDAAGGGGAAPISSAVMVAPGSANLVVGERQSSGGYPPQAQKDVGSLSPSLHLRKIGTPLWQWVLELCEGQRYLDAYKQVIAEPDETCLLKLMQHTGPIVEHLDAESNSRLIRRLIHLLSSPAKEIAATNIKHIFAWLWQALRSGIHFTASQVEDLAKALHKVSSTDWPIGANERAEASQLLARVSALKR